MRDEHTIDALIVETKSGRRAVRGRVFVDASGDGDLACWAGAPWEKGDAAGRLLYPTLMFRVNNVDAVRAGDAVNDINRLMQEAEATGDYRFPRKGAIVRPQKHANEWRANVTQLRNADGSAVDGTDALQLSAGEIEGRRQIRDYMGFLRARVPGFESSYLLDIAPQLGIRETRRVVGHAMLAAEDVLGCRSFPDTVGVNAWPLERHVAGDVQWSWPPIPESRGFNHLPYRMLVARRIGNLLVAGRCASMTSEAQSAARVSGGCFVMGQAAGTAAHLALAAGTAPRTWIFPYCRRSSSATAHGSAANKSAILGSQPDEETEMKTLFAALALAVPLAGTVLAQPAGSGRAADAGVWPAKTIRMIVPFPPGSSPDLVARMLNDKLGTRSASGDRREPTWRGRQPGQPLS